MGNALATLRPGLNQTFPPKSKFSVDQIPDLSGRVVIVTGGNTGVGKETVKVLLERNAKVYMASRSKDRADAAIQDLKASSGKEAIFLELDLGNLASVRRAAEEFLSKEKELHILFNNAGVMIPPRKLFTADGYDLQWGTNVIGHFFFTHLLLPALIAGKESSPDGHTRIVTTSSFAAYLSVIHWDSFKDGPGREKVAVDSLYAQSKLGNFIFARQFAQRYADQGILSYACNPGNLKTELQRHVPFIAKQILGLILYPAPFGALTQLWAGTMPEVIVHNGQFLIPWARVGRCREEAYDAELGERLWKYLMDEIKDKQLVGQKFGVELRWGFAWFDQNLVFDLMGSLDR